MEGRSQELKSEPAPWRSHPDPAVTVRAAEVADLARLAGIEEAAGQRFRDVGLDSVADDPPPPIALFAEAQRRAHLWVAGVDGELVGYAWGVMVGDQPHLEQVSVLPAFGGMGIGAALVDRTSAWAAEQGAASLTLSTFRDVAFNGPWYRRIGFVEIPDPDLDPRWQELRRLEADAGLDVESRVIMRRPVQLVAS